jgi:hypothetical protein
MLWTDTLAIGLILANLQSLVHLNIVVCLTVS